MTELPETMSADTADRTTWMRRYTLDPALAEEFVEFLTKEVFPAREGRGFTVESVWLDSEKSQLTWFVSRLGDSAEFAAAERAWEESEERAEIFAGKPKYVTDKDVREVTRLR
ncbi:hypothetical protein FEF26_02900 [Nesterenkonia salmonea]|uniref:NIPSNAP domain-containing protein n=1 Tax=Nesterenkonia salmonea TaxID=1804987 RepID=A0A5R9BI37_9MICC|nr:hypothetical protein [Nesterenkonia salmonea]TLP99570.1 hypothetical protein FEF26_02900 [Nesterenkonia salmonea]